MQLNWSSQLHFRVARQGLKSSLKTLNYVGGLVKQVEDRFFGIDGAKIKYIASGVREYDLLQDPSIRTTPNVYARTLSMAHSFQRERVPISVNMFCI